MNTPFEVAPDILARHLEERGYDSLWVGEHTHIPVSRRTPYPAGGEMPEPYRHMMDPFVALTVAAMATTELIVGTGVALPLEHDVFSLAKSVATLDLVSRGRVQFGVGVGWNEEELANHQSFPWSRRYLALADCVEALRRLWCDEEAEHHGQFFDFDPVWSSPKPTQKPHPPIVCGMSGRLGTQHAVAWADAWMPIDVGLGNVAKQVGKFRAALESAGRDPGSLPITMIVWGDPSPALLAEYRDLGIERAVLGSAREGWGDGSSTLAWIDRYAALAHDLRQDQL